MRATRKPLCGCTHELEELGGSPPCSPSNPCQSRCNELWIRNDSFPLPTDPARAKFEKAKRVSCYARQACVFRDSRRASILSTKSKRWCQISRELESCPHREDADGRIRYLFATIAATPRMQRRPNEFWLAAKFQSGHGVLNPSPPTYCTAYASQISWRKHAQ